MTATKALLQTSQLLEKLRSVIKAYQEDDYDTAMTLIAAVEKTATPEQLHEFLYYRAVILDLRGKTMDSLELFLKLRQEAPGQTAYLSSLKIVFKNLCDQARQLHLENPEAQELAHFDEFLRAHYFSPWWLTVAVAKQSAKAGQVIPAKRRVQDLLALSPNDSDFLRCALELALQIGDRLWENELRKRIAELAERKPYQAGLASLVGL